MRAEKTNYTSSEFKVSVLESHTACFYTRTDTEAVKIQPGSNYLPRNSSRHVYINSQITLLTYYQPNSLWFSEISSLTRDPDITSSFIENDCYAYIDSLLTISSRAQYYTRTPCPV